MYEGTSDAKDQEFSADSITVNIENRTCRVNMRTHENVVVDQKATRKKEMEGLRSLRSLNPLLKYWKSRSRRIQYKPLMEFRRNGVI